VGEKKTTVIKRELRGSEKHVTSSRKRTHKENVEGLCLGQPSGGSTAAGKRGKASYRGKGAQSNKSGKGLQMESEEPEDRLVKFESQDPHGNHGGEGTIQNERATAD